MILITGSGGLIGSEAVRFYAPKDKVIGIDNDKRQFFFGKEGSTQKSITAHKTYENYAHFNIDICDYKKIEAIFKKNAKSISLIIHTAAQPSHDWAATQPIIDFNINASATLNLLEMTRKYCPKAVFVYMSSSKVYGDTCNSLPLKESRARFDLSSGHHFYNGINESMSIDNCTHSFLGASKLCADIYVQEYGRYFGLKTVCFRCGCLTGSGHAGVPLHGFLAYLMKCAKTGKKYVINGYEGKQVRDNIHSSDVIGAIDLFYKNPQSSGEVYNLGGGRSNSCSVLEAISMCESILCKKMKVSYNKKNRLGDHKWYISDNTKFLEQYPFYDLDYTLNDILVSMALDVDW